MHMFKKAIVAATLFFSVAATAQDAVSYQLPPKTLQDLLLAKPTPSISLDNKGEWMLLIERNSYPSVEEMAQPEFRIAGLRINPNNFSLSRQTFINNFRLRNLKTNAEVAISGLPANLLAGNPSWSPDEKKIAFTASSNDRIDLYVVDVATHKATKVNTQPLNATIGQPFIWDENNTLIYKTTVQSPLAAPKRSLMPQGPVVQQNLGKAAPSRTYQDMIKSPYDEALFDFFATSQLVRNVNGKETKIGKPAIYSSVSLSPDKKYVLARTVRKPFSYIVPAGGFNSTVSILDKNGNTVKVLAELPSSETSPSGFDNIQNSPRSFEWRDDAAATLVWSSPLDSGMYRNKMDHHDAVYSLAAPFTGEPKLLFKTNYRFRDITWGNDQLALITEGLQGKQMARVSKYNPSTGEVSMLFERSTNDAYSNPGSPVTHRNQYGRNVITTIDNGSKLLLNNPTGSSPKGDLPFLATFDLNTKERNIIWRSDEGGFETITDVIDPQNLVVVTRKESQTLVPNYWIRNLKLRLAPQQITQFTNPYPALEGIVKQKISYKRADGVDLTGDLYLPKGYDAKKDGPLPVFIWAYPREFNNASDAAQVRGSQYTYTRLGWGSPIFWATQGYAVLDNAEMPIVGAEGKKPNDNFIDQLKLNAEAAIGKLADMGVGDRKRVAVGGHSYGAFMTANLLAHTNLFKAGLARSGAYNRTLTPFGFQNEDRTYWEAPQLYHQMSPFSYADKIKTPLLLIHGEMDDNPGTFPINSERLYAAIKGHGGTTRFVSLPYEAHSYRGKENLLHMLYEMNAWLDKYVKNAK
jgi:dipeptidyl aminopeptidase/acylaminoacyl peptidase